MSVYCEQRILTIFGGGVGNFMLNFLSHFFFNFENLSAHNVANILNFPKHLNTLSFWILDEFEGSYGCFSTKYHFFGTPCRYVPGVYSK